MKIISWNVNGIRACAKKGFLEFLDREDPDILCIQETKAHPDQLDATLLEPPGRYAYWSSAQKKGYSGTATYVKKEALNVIRGIQIRKFDDEGRFVVTEHPDFFLYNVYFPNGSASDERHQFKQDFLKRFHRHLLKQRDLGKALIVLGDYNVAHQDIDVFDPIRLSTVSGFLPEEREWFSQFLNSGFTDTFRRVHPNAKERYSWWSYREGARMANRGWRLDYICVTNDLKSKIKSAEILDQQMGSDHCPVVLQLTDLLC